MIERFVQVLRKAGFDPTPEDVADLLWLASFLPPPPAVEAPAPLRA